MAKAMAADLWAEREMVGSRWLRARPASLRATLAVMTVFVTVLAVGVSVALMTLTTLLHRTSQDLAASVENVRLAHDAKTDLLYARASDGPLRIELEGELRRMLDDARLLVRTSREHALLDEAGSRVERYFVAAHDRRAGGEITPLLDAAFEALDALSDENVRQARLAQARSGRWDRVANVLGLATAALTILGSGTLLWWLGARAFRPLLSLARAMERYGRGEHDARAAERGPAELREMSHRFNDMAGALAVQRAAQIAFLGGVAHDLRTPLSSLRVAVTLLDPQRVPADEHRVSKTVRLLERNIARMERMLEDFLDLARIQAGQLELRLGDEDLREIVRDGVALFEPAAGHRLVLSLPADPLRIRCDAVRIGQVVVNLISNAIKYSPAGELVDVRLERRGNHAVLRVIDRGIGISREDQRHVFEPFRRVGPSKGSLPGAGLGLFVVKQIVHAHRGMIEVDSRPGQGSEFRVSLPLAR
jgi:signal transduction histidine kinase